MSRILVTGASTGLGRLTALSLAQDGHEVILHARNPSRVEDAALLGRVYGVVYGDLGDLDQTRRVANEVNGFGRLEAVIHNAGVIDGSELAAVNFVAPFVLTALMEPPARAIVLSSSMHRSGTPRHLADWIAGLRDMTYSDSKLYVTALAMAIAHRWPTVLTHAVDPGWVPTRMGGPSATDDLTEGHRTQEWLATTGDAQIQPRTGGYWHHRRVQKPHPAALDRSFQDEVIRCLEDRTLEALPRM